MTLPTSRTLLTLLLALLTTIAAPRASAQCTPTWQPFDSTTAALPGVNGTVAATTIWDPDGPGPQTPKLVAAGVFTIAGSTFTNRVAMYDPTTKQWSSLTLGSDVEGPVHALAVLPTGDLVAAGQFYSTSSTSGPRTIARWNGSAWIGFRPPQVSAIYALAVLPNGDLVAGGNFSFAGHGPAFVARWNGATWAPMSTNINGTARALVALPNGDLVAGGDFEGCCGNEGIRHIARWNGSTWLPMGNGLGTAPVVRTLVTLPSGDVVAGGANLSAPDIGVAGLAIARWNGSVWSPISAGTSGIFEVVNTLAVLPSGDLVAAGAFQTADGVSARNIARWNGSAWAPLANGISSSDSSTEPRSLAVLPNGDLVVAGVLNMAGDATVAAIALWNGSTWGPLSDGVTVEPNAFASLPTGDLIAAGRFANLDGRVTTSVVRWRGSRWTTVGESFTGTAPDDPENTFGTLALRALTTLPNGNIIAGGSFTAAGGIEAKNIALWNGATWTPLATGIDDDVYALATLPTGDIIAGGQFATAGTAAARNIARWNGSTWSPLGTGIDGVFVGSLLTLPNGSLVVGGQFTGAGTATANNLALWDGSAWSQLGPGLTSPVYALTQLPNGDLVAASRFVVSVLNNSTWTTLGTATNNSILALSALANSHIVAAGTFTAASGLEVSRVALWDNSWWRPMEPGPNNTVRVLTTLPSGDLIAGGNFTASGSTVTPYIARYTSTPPCYANCNCSPDGLNSLDFQCFLTNYRNAAPSADCNNSGTLSPADFTCFLNRYRDGCP